MKLPNLVSQLSKLALNRFPRSMHVDLTVLHEGKVKGRLGYLPAVVLQGVKT